jgi:uncharacterized tellurite resistance protein B-like protein
MLKALREFLDQQLNTSVSARDPQEALQIAAAALWVEMMRADGEMGRAERDAVLQAVREKFAVSAEQARTLVQAAEDAATRATDYFEFTSLLNQHFTPEQKEQVVAHLWQVAYADGKLDAHEEHFVRKIADLLYVSHGAYIGAKLRAARKARK